VAALIVLPLPAVQYRIHLGSSIDRLCFLTLASPWWPWLAASQSPPDGWVLSMLGASWKQETFQGRMLLMLLWLQDDAPQPHSDFRSEVPCVVAPNHWLPLLDPETCFSVRGAFFHQPFFDLHEDLGTNLSLRL
jgi:hypothetical protein